MARTCGGFGKRVMRLTELVMDDAVPGEWRCLDAVWRDPSAPICAAKGNAAVKPHANGTGGILLEQAWVDLSYAAEKRGQMPKWDEKKRAASR